MPMFVCPFSYLSLFFLLHMQTMHIKMYKFVCILLVYMIVAVFAQQQECQGKEREI